MTVCKLFGKKKFHKSTSIGIDNSHHEVKDVYDAENHPSI